MKRHQPQITSQITRADAEALLARAVRLGLDLLHVSAEGFVRFRNLRLGLSTRGKVSVQDYVALLGVVQREEAKWAGKCNYYAPFRPQPTPRDGLQTFPMRLPFTVIDANVSLSVSDTPCGGGMAFIGSLQSAKSVKAGHVLKVFIREHEKSVIGFDSKGAHEWDFFAAEDYPVLHLTVGESGSGGLFYNPYTDEGGIPEVLSQLDILAVCTERKDSHGLLIHAAEHFFAARQAGSHEQLTFAKILSILTNVVTPTNHGHLFQRQLWPSVLNAISSLTAGFGDCFAVEAGLSIDALIRNHGSVWVNSSNLTLGQEEYLLASMGWKLYETSRRVFANDPDRQTRTVLFVDECSAHLTPKLDQDQRHLGPISELILKARGG